MPNYEEKVESNVNAQWKISRKRQTIKWYGEFWWEGQVLTPHETTFWHGADVSQGGESKLFFNLG